MFQFIFNKSLSDITPKSIYDLRYLPMYAQVRHWVRLCFAEVIGLHDYHVSFKSDKNIALVCELMSRDPKPMLDYLAGGPLRRFSLIGDGTKKNPYKYEWSEDYFKDTI